jgi:DNA-3-methyladenine glycosylase II
MADAFDHEPPIAIDEASAIAAKWSPWRGVAARLFWTYYRVRREKAAVPV